MVPLGRTGHHLSGGEVTTFVVVVVDGRRFGLPLDAVEEVQPAVALAPLPGAPVLVEGLLDLRGDVLPVVDGRRALGHPSRPTGLSDRLVVLHTTARRLAVRVDEVVDLVEAPTRDAAAAAASAPEALRLAGVARLDDGLVVIHDPEAWLTAEDRDRLAGALATAGRAGGADA